MPGAPPTSPAPFRVADTLELPSVVWFELAPED